MAAARLTLRRLVRAPLRPTLAPLARMATSSYAVAILVAGAMALRLSPWLTSYPLHRDEALYGYWARMISSGADPLLLTQWVDKPPLVLYLEALSLRLLGPSIWALRLPGMVAGIFLAAATWGLATQLFGGRAGFLAGSLVVASPFAILFSPTAFTDPWLTLFMVSAAWAAAARRSWLAGVLCGLAIASKQQGLLAVALVLAMLWLAHLPTRAAAHAPARRRDLLLDVSRWAGGLALVMVPLFYWDQLRWVTRPSFWDRSLATYGGLGFAPIISWPQRAHDWATQIGLLWGVPLLSWIALIAGSIGVSIPQRVDPVGGEPDRAFGDAPFGTAVDRALVFFVAGYLLLHLVLSFQAWDRYLLPLVPLLAIIVARAWLRGWWALKARLALKERSALMAGKSGRAKRQAWLLAWLLAIAVLLLQARVGVGATIPVGSDHGAYTGLDQVVAELRARPADAVIYHRWLGWHYDFYLFDAPQERRWWGTAWKLADDAAKTAEEQPEREQWIALPGWEDAEVGAVRVALASHRLELVEVMRTLRSDGSRSFTLFRIDPVRGTAHG